MLTQGMDVLTREILTAREARAEALSTLHDATRTQLARLAGVRTKAMADQRARLARAQVELATRIRDQLRQQHDSRAAASLRQRTRLAQQRNELATSETRRRGHFTTWIRPITADRASARKKWRALVVSVRERRTPRTAAGAKSPSAGRPVAVDHGADALDHLHRQILDYLTSRTQGSRLTDLERHLGMARLQVARAVKALMKEGWAEKRDLLYFATSSPSRLVDAPW